MQSKTTVPHESLPVVCPSPTFGDSSTEASERPLQVIGESTSQVRKKTNTQLGQWRTAALQGPLSKLSGWAEAWKVPILF